jgi:PmbA protein
MERDYDYTSALHASDLASPEKRRPGRRRARGGAAQSAQGRDLQGAGGVRSARRRARWSAHLVGAINGASIARKTSFLKDRSASSCSPGTSASSTIRCASAALRSQPFDAEGVAVKKLAIIDEGVLTSWLLDCATARELGLVTTGHAHRGVSSSPSPGSYNLHLEAGTQTPAELIADIKQGFYVTDLIGWASTASPAITAAAPPASGSRTANSPIR